ncbi:Outer cell wall protein precursor [compost metagenome]
MTDDAGNVTTVQFTIDTTPPIVSGVLDGAQYNSDVSPTFNEGTATLNGVNYSSGTIITLDGHYILVITDHAGNTTTVTFTVDRIAPTGTLVINQGYAEYDKLGCK